MLFSTNISTELFEYAHNFGVSAEELKELLIRNVDAIFDDSCKEWLRERIQNYRIWTEKIAMKSRFLKNYSRKKLASFWNKDKIYNMIHMINTVEELHDLKDD